MTRTDWPAEYEKLLRAYVPLLPNDTPLSPDGALADWGLDSLTIVGLLLDVEEYFGVQFPDDDLSPKAFATAEALWSVGTRLREAATG